MAKEFIPEDAEQRLAGSSPKQKQPPEELEAEITSEGLDAETGREAPGDIRLEVVKAESLIAATRGESETAAREDVEAVLTAGGSPEQVAEAYAAGETLVSETNEAAAVAQGVLAQVQ